MSSETPQRLDRSLDALTPLQQGGASSGPEAQPLELHIRNRVVDPWLVGMQVGDAIWQAIYGGDGPLGKR
jgi:hypothetical protein